MKILEWVFVLINILFFEPFLCMAQKIDNFKKKEED